MNKFWQWVLTVALSGIGVKLMDFVPWDKVVDKENWSWIFENRFNLLHVVVFITVGIFVWFLINYFSRQKEDPVEKKLKEFNEMTYSDINVKVTWEMYTGAMYDHDPHPYNIKMFCLNHGEVPQLMERGCCRYTNCENNRYPGIDENAVKSEIESRLLHYRDQITKK